MRNSHRQSHSLLEGKWVWLIVIGIIVAFIVRFFSSSSGDTRPKEGISISGSGQFVIIDSKGKRHDVTESDVLTKDDKTLSILTGIGILENTDGKAWFDKKSEVSSLGDDTEKTGYKLSQGRSWIESDREMIFSLKHIDATLAPDTVALIEQQPIHSIVYILKGSARIVASGGKETTLGSLRRIMVSQSDLANPGTTLESLSDAIDDSIKQNAFFLARGGSELLEKTKQETVKGGPIGSSGGLSGTSSTIVSGASSGKYIMITNPQDGSKIAGSSFRVEGYTLSPLVKSITINDSTAVISGTGIFVSGPLSAATSAIDIVYKAYDASGNLLERGLLTVMTDTKAGVEKLVPTTFPTSDKDFRFSSPKENPYKTSLSAVTVSGTVPKGAVEYITVNGYKLKKFAPYSGSWYYYANTAYQTMKEGFNLYEIRFYGPNNTLLSSQLFTIIKEGGSVSGE